VRDRVLHVLGQLGVGLLKAIGLEDGVPAKVLGATCGHDLALPLLLPLASSTVVKKKKSKQTHKGASLKDNGLCIRPTRVGEHAQRVGALVLVGREQVVQPVVAQLFEEPLAVCNKQVSDAL